MFWIQIASYVKKCSSKHGDYCFMNLTKTPLYKYLNVTIHHQSASLFTLYIDSKFKIFNFSDASSDNFNSNNE
jgi:hypothetical protein